MMPYTMVAPPNVKAPIGVMAIVPGRAKVTPQAAASLAKFARHQFSTVKSWKAMQVFVFRNTTSAQIFNAYQMKRKHGPLRVADYVALKKLWPKVLAFHEHRNGRDRFLYPSRNSAGWWRSR